MSGLYIRGNQEKKDILGSRTFLLFSSFNPWNSKGHFLQDQVAQIKLYL